MVVLVTMTQALVALDLESGASATLDRGRGVYYGLAYSEDRVYVAARKCPYGVKLPERAAQRGVIIEYDADLNELGEIEPPFPLRDLHQIHWAFGRLWVCSTHDDMIAVYDPAADGAGESGTAAWDRWFPAGEPEPIETPHGMSTDLHHFNSVWSDDRSLYVLANKKGTGTIHAFDAANRTPTQRVELGAGAHNVWGEGGELFTLSSKEGTLISTGGRRVEFGGFTRGVVAPEDAALPRVVGVSSRAKREVRAVSDAELVVCDHDWREARRITIRGEGMVHDVRAPGVRDLAHPGALGRAIQPAVARVIGSLASQDPSLDPAPAAKPV